MSARSPQTAVAEPTPYEVLSIDEIMDRYTGEWLLMRATQHDRDGWPTYGFVTVHAPSQQEMLDEMESQPTEPEHARLVLHSFFADRRCYIDDPEEIRRFIDDWIKSDADID